MSTKIAKAEAAKVLAEVWGEAGIPVDPVFIASELGIDVREGSLPAYVSGFIMKQPGSDPVIVLEKEDSPNRQRFTCAHEIGHFIQRAGAEEYEFVDYRGPSAAAGTQPEEIWANAFAANLLMPEADVRADASEDLALVARKFGVSPEAMRIRWETLGIRR